MIWIKINNCDPYRRNIAAILEVISLKESGGYNGRSTKRLCLQLPGIVTTKQWVIVPFSFSYRAICEMKEVV